MLKVHWYLRGWSLTLSYFFISTIPCLDSTLLSLSSRVEDLCFCSTFQTRHRGPWPKIQKHQDILNCSINKCKAYIKQNIGNYNLGPSISSFIPQKSTFYIRWPCGQDTQLFNKQSQSVLNGTLAIIIFGPSISTSYYGGQLFIFIGQWSRYSIIQ